VQLVNKHSLWLVPPDPQRKKLRDLIDDFARACDALPFEPHLTLVGDINAPSDKIARCLKPIIHQTPSIDLNLGEVVNGTDFFMSLYFEVEPTTELLGLQREVVSRCFSGGAHQRDFLPHISLAYGEIPDPKRRLFVRRAQELLPISFSVSKVDIVRASACSPIETWTFVKELTFTCIG
jgi:2'-5' RNA ligase